MQNSPQITIRGLFSFRLGLVGDIRPAGRSPHNLEKFEPLLSVRSGPGHLGVPLILPLFNQFPLENRREHDPLMLGIQNPPDGVDQDLLEGLVFQLFLSMAQTEINDSA